MPDRSLEIVCLTVGDVLSDDYVDRLYRMLVRHSGRPFRLSCLTDRTRQFAEPVQQIPILQEAVYRPEMRPTQYKLSLFKGGGWPCDEFIYLDVTIIVKSSLKSLWEFFDSRSESLVTLRDWKWDTVNSSVMRVKKDSMLASVYEDYVAGVKYETRLNGDQDFISASIRAHKLESAVCYLPKPLVASYKELRRMNRLSPARARSAFANASIIKFHGHPRPHEILETGYWIEYVKKNPMRALRDRDFLVKELTSEFVTT